jgi:hypothetical protein
MQVSHQPPDSHVSVSVPRFLNVGGGSKSIPVPDHYRGWIHLLLDIDPAGNPDVVCDARELAVLEPAIVDAVYCSHNLEHYYQHDVPKVLKGFRHVLKSTGFAEIRVPDLRSVMHRFASGKLDIDDVLYASAAGPISVHDVIYGWGAQIEKSGVDFYAHKTGFTDTALRRRLQDAGFHKVLVAENREAFELCALAFKHEPTPEQLIMFGL